MSKRCLNPILFCAIFAVMAAFFLESPYEGILNTFYIIGIGLLGSATALSCFICIFSEYKKPDHGSEQAGESGGPADPG